MQKLQMLFDYLRYYISAQSKHDIHSPFVFDFTTRVINATTKHATFAEIENCRQKLLCNNTAIVVSDFGAGTLGNMSKKKTIALIAKKSAKSAKYAQLLYRIVHYFKPQNMLELGTSFGISTLYQAKANPNSNFVTIEGCDAVAAIAKNNFTLLNVKNVELISGPFDEKLSFVIAKLKTLDYVFFDGNHRKMPTLDYFNTCLEKANPTSIFIFDDINWSTEMKQAWAEIKKHPRVTVSIDLFMMGVVFFNTDFTKEEFKIRF